MRKTPIEEAKEYIRYTINKETSVIKNILGRRYDNIK